MSKIKIFTLLFFISFTSFVSAEEESLNQFITHYNNKKPIYLGPNCFSTALAAVNVLPYSGYVDGKQFQTLLESPLCKEIKTVNSLRRGDLLLLLKVEGNTRTPVHASVYLDSNSIFEKASNANSDSPRIKTHHDSLAPYTNKSLSELMSKESNVLVSAFRCDNYKAFLEKYYKSWYKNNKRVINQLFSRDERIAQMVQSPEVNLDAIRMTVTSLATSLRSLSFIEKNQSLKYPHKLGLREKIWDQAPEEVKLIFKLRFTDHIFQLQNIIYSQVLNN